MRDHGLKAALMGGLLFAGCAGGGGDVETGPWGGAGQALSVEVGPVSGNVGGLSLSAMPLTGNAWRTGGSLYLQAGNTQLGSLEEPVPEEPADPAEEPTEPAERPEPVEPVGPQVTIDWSACPEDQPEALQAISLTICDGPTDSSICYHAYGDGLVDSILDEGGMRNVALHAVWPDGSELATSLRFQAP
jgi:hypothetical protein